MPTTLPTPTPSLSFLLPPLPTPTSTPTSARTRPRSHPPPPPRASSSPSPTSPAPSTSPSPSSPRPAAGWVRRAPALSGRAVFSEQVQWSVPDMSWTPDNALEAAVWRKGVEVEYARETLPFLALRARVMAKEGVRPARRGAVVEALLAAGAGGVGGAVVGRSAGAEAGVVEEAREGVEEGGWRTVWVETGRGGEEEELGREVVTFDGKEAEVMWRAGEWEHVAEVRDAVGEAVPVVYADVVAHSYQLFRARDLGADAAVLMVAVFPATDLRYNLKALRSLSMAAIVEVHTPEELRFALELPREDVDVILLADRDLDSPTLRPRPLAAALETFREVLDSGLPDGHAPLAVLAGHPADGEPDSVQHSMPIVLAH